MEGLWDISRVAEYLGVSERTVYNRVRAGEMPAIKVGRLWRVRPSDLEEWLAGGRAEAGTRPPAKTSTVVRGRYPIPTNRPPDVPGPYPLDSATAPDLAAAETGPMPTRADLEALLAPLSDRLDRRLAFIGLLTQGVRTLGWPAPVVVGGQAVQFYTAGDFPTIDIDLAGASEPVSHVLEAWGFAREGRHWYDEAFDMIVEVPGNRPGPEELEHVLSVRQGVVIAYILGIEDVVVDRLCAAKFWRDTDARMWAETMLAGTPELDSGYLRRRAAEEQVLDELERLLGEDES